MGTVSHESPKTRSQNLSQLSSSVWTLKIWISVKIAHLLKLAKAASNCAWLTVLVTKRVLTIGLMDLKDYISPSVGPHVLTLGAQTQSSSTSFITLYRLLIKPTGMYLSCMLQLFAHQSPD
jgi:hypothetical protein